MKFVDPALGWAARLGPLRPLLRWLCSRRVSVVGSSMYPLLHPGDVVLSDPFAYRSEMPRRGDVVVVEHAASPAGKMIKTVAALPGECVEIRQDKLWVDGRALSLHGPVVGSLPGRWRVGEGELFLLSYAMAVGTDSREIGPVDQRQILGRGWYVLPPSPRAGRLNRLPYSR